MIARCGLLIAIGVSLAMAGAPAAFAAAPITDGKQVPTLTIPIAPDPNDGADESTPVPCRMRPLSRPPPTSPSRRSSTTFPSCLPR